MAILKFPMEYNDGCPLVVFKPFEYRFPYANTGHASLEKGGKPPYASDVSLYLPAGFQESGGANWEFQDVIGGDQQGAGANIGQEFLKGMATAAGNKITGTVSAIAGKIVAPMDILVYGGPAPTELSFAFQMLSVSEKENAVAVEIAKMFKRAYQPKRIGGDAFTILYPALWTISFIDISGLGHDKTSVYDWMALTKVDVSYVGDTGIHVYQSDKRPIQTNLNLSFKYIKKVWD